MKDMKEPIEYYSPTGHISDADNNYISAIRGWGRLVVTSKDEQEATERQDAIAQRIVTCVNACAGMENPEKEIEQLEADKAELIDALEWYTYLSHGVSKGGDSPTSKEWEDCTRQSVALLDKLPKETV